MCGVCGRGRALHLVVKENQDKQDAQKPSLPRSVRNFGDGDKTEGEGDRRHSSVVEHMGGPIPSRHSKEEVSCGKRPPLRHPKVTGLGKCDRIDGRVPHTH